MPSSHTVPTSIFFPIRYAFAAMRLPPGACISRISSAPSPQRTTSPSLGPEAITVPGAASESLSTARARYSLSRPPSMSV